MRRALLMALTAIGLGGVADARATEVHTVVGTLGYDIQRDALPLIDVAIGAECVYQELDVGDVIELVRQGVAPVTLEPGAHEAAVLEAGGACSGAPLVTGRADVPASPLPGQADSAAALIVAELDASGAPGSAPSPSTPRRSASGAAGSPSSTAPRRRRSICG